MRLHRLEVTAFGPFADTVEVDFDALSDAGLFLLGGATGAGKSSVLDAVCFALYGRVPGVRDGAKRLHSDHAPADLAPRVVLDLTVAGRRLRVDRSPAWLRPKRRGTGTTPEKPRVLVTERVSDDEPPVTRAARADEAGHFLDGLLGMNLGQFTQVAMLPQGDVEAFLRAESKDRQALLQKLFRTDRFAAVEAWLREHRIRVRRRHDAAIEVLADHASRLSETAAEPLPAEYGDGLALPAGDGRLLGWAVSLCKAARLSVAAVDLAVQAADEEARAARARHEAAVVEHDRTSRQRAADQRRRNLAAAGPGIAVDRRRRQEARRAEPVRLRIHDMQRAVAENGAALRAERTAELAAASALAELAGRLGGPAPSVESDELDRAAERLEAAVPRARRLARLDADLATASADEPLCQARVTAARARLKAMPQQVELARHAVAESERAESECVAAAAAVEWARGRVSARAEADALSVEVAEAAAELASARDLVLQRRTHALDLREQRLTGMAAELAGNLAAGCSCPVCGSPEHPAKASAAPGAPTEADERAANSLVADAVVIEEAHRDRNRLLEQRLAAARARCGDESTTTVAAELRDAESRLAETEQLAERLAEACEGLRAARAEERSAGAAVEAAETELAALDVHVAALRAELGALREEQEEVAALRGDVAASDPAGLAALALAYERATDAADALEDARDEHESCAQAMLDVEGEMHRLARAADFLDLETALTAKLEPESVDELDARIGSHEREVAAVDALLAELGVAAGEPIPDTPLPDVGATAAALEAASARLETRQSEHALAARRTRRLVELYDDLGDAVAAWRPVADELALAVRMAALVDGSSPDNELRISLSAFVLGHRLAQVVEAANVRLGPMMAHRYRLEHTSHRASGDRRGGLSLLVRDTWTGEARDPATLSGGETFVVSLALALGLADVVSAEAGGATLDTLFVDEGFGALDADTLDDVLDALDSLRAGGRVVGVVSHVSEMRDRIPARLEVRKSRTGSTVSTLSTSSPSG